MVSRRVRCHGIWRQLEEPRVGVSTELFMAFTTVVGRAAFAVLIVCKSLP